MNRTDLPINTRNLAAIIERRHIKKAWLACAIGVTPKTLRRWLNGSTRLMRRDNFDALVEALGEKHRSELMDTGNAPLGSRSDQQQSAIAISRRPFEELFLGTADYPLMESLLRTTLLPELPEKIQARLYSDLALACFRQGKMEECKEHARRTLELNPEEDVAADARYRLAAALLFEARIRDAIRAFAACLRSGITEPYWLSGVWTGLGVAWNMEGDLKKSDRAHRAAMYRIPAIRDEARRHLRLARTYTFWADTRFEIGDIPGALNMIRQSNDLYSGAGIRHSLHKNQLKMAWILASDGKREEALDLYSRHRRPYAKTQTKQQYATRINMVTTLRLCGRQRTAMVLARQLLAETSPAPHAFFHARVLLEMSWLSSDPLTRQSYLREAAHDFHRAGAWSRSRALTERIFDQPKGQALPG